MASFNRKRTNVSGFGRRRFLAGTGALTAGVAALGVVGCGDDDDDGNDGGNGDGGAAGTTTGTAVASGSPVAGGTLNQPLPANPVTFDPHTDAASFSMMSFIGLVYSKLLELDSQFKYQSDLAESVEQPDDQTVVFHLRPGVKWQDLDPVNGREMTAEDVKFSLERMGSSEPEFLRSYQFELMDRVEIVDPATVRVTLSQPFAPFLTYVASEWSAIVAPEVVERFGNLKSFDSLIGTGPYIRDRSEPDVVHVVKANPNYFRAGQPYIQEIRGLVVADAATRDANLRSKSLDISFWGGLPVDGLDDLKRSTKMVFQQWPGTWYYVDRLNLEKVPAFKDARVRKALHLATNRQASINAVFGGEGKLNGPVPWAFEDFALTQDELLQTPGYSQNKDADIAEAKRLLDAAGHSDLTFKILSTTGNREPEVRQADFQRIGVNTEIEIVDTPGILSRMAQENFEFTAWLDNAFWDPDDYLYGNTHTDGGRNYQGYSNSDIDRMIEAQRGELDLAQRSEMVREVQRKIIDESPYLSIGSINAWWAWWPYLKNRQLSGALNPYQYKDCWLDTSDETWHG